MMSGCSKAVVETGRVPCKGMAGQLVDAKAWLLWLSRYVVGNFPFEMTGWHTLLPLVCWWCQHFGLTDSQTHARGRSHLFRRRLMNKACMQWTQD